MYRYYTNGVCAKSILLDIEDDVVLDVAFEGGCEGALIAIKNLVRGQNIDYIIDTLGTSPMQDERDIMSRPISKCTKNI